MAHSVDILDKGYIIRHETEAHNVASGLLPTKQIGTVFLNSLRIVLPY